jgi:hypothetical protein
MVQFAFLEWIRDLVTSGISIFNLRSLLFISPFDSRFKVCAHRSSVELGGCLCNLSEVVSLGSEIQMLDKLHEDHEAECLIFL